MVTIKDVARTSGFSIATVSAVINNAPIVSKEAREKILQAIDELGYKPNYIARSLKSAKTNTIGVLMRGNKNAFYAELISEIEEVAWKNGYTVFVCNIQDQPDREKKYIEKMLEKRVDGIIISTVLVDRPDYLTEIAKQNVPFVFLNRKPDNLLEDEIYVGSNNQLASEIGVEYLNKLGYNKIAFMASNQQYSTFRDRKRGFIKAMDSYQIPIVNDWLVTMEDSQENGSEYIKKLIKDRNLPDAIFCCTDSLAFGVYRELIDSGYRIPEDVALLSIDNSPLSSLINLTTIDVNSRKMGGLSCETLIKMIKEKNTNIDQKIVNLEPTLIIRNTCD